MRLSKSLKQLITNTARDAYAKGVADGERKILTGLKAVAQLNGSAERLLKGGWDEGKHPRAADGRFGDKPGEHRGSADGGYTSAEDIEHPTVRAKFERLLRRAPEETRGEVLARAAAEDRRVMRRVEQLRSTAVRSPQTGDPLLAFHGTDQSFDRFADRPTFFTPSAGYDFVRRSPHVHAAYLDMRNPYRTQHPREVEAATYAGREFIDELKAKGYDGIIYSSPDDITKGALGYGDDHPQMVVFSASQIIPVQRYDRDEFDGRLEYDDFSPDGPVQSEALQAYRDAPEPVRKAEPDDSHAIIVSAMLRVAEDAADTGDDPADALRALADLSQDPDRLRDVLAGGTLQKAWDESKHPRADNGRFIGKDQLQAAKSDPALAQKLRDKTTDPGERAKLDKVLSGEADPGRTKRGEQRHQSRQKRAATESDRRRAHQLAMRAFQPGGLGYDDYEELADLLPSLTVEQLRAVRAAVGASWGGQRLKRQGMVDTLVAFARQQAAPPEQDAPGSPGWAQRVANLPDKPRAGVDAWESAKVDDAADRAERMGAWESDRPDSEAAGAVAGAARADLAGARGWAADVATATPGLSSPPPADNRLDDKLDNPEPEPAAKLASRLDELEADASRRLAEAERPLTGNRYADVSDADLGAVRHRLAAKVAGLKQSATATGDEAVTAEAKAARDRLAEADAELSRRVLAARLRRRLQAVQESRESGRLTVSESEMRELLAQAKDAYREDGLRGRVPYSPDHFRTSDLTGAKVRHFVELPDGRIAHPDELTQAQRRGRLNVVPDAELPGAFTTARTAEQLAAAPPAQPPIAEPVRDAGNPPEGPHPASVPADVPQGGGQDFYSTLGRDAQRHAVLGRKLATAGALLPVEAVDYATGDGSRHVTAGRAEVVLTNRLGLTAADAKSLLAKIKPATTLTVGGNRKRPGYDVLDLFRAAGKLYEPPAGNNPESGHTPPPPANSPVTGQSGPDTGGEPNGRGQRLSDEVRGGAGGRGGAGVGAGDGPSPGDAPRASGGSPAGEPAPAGGRPGNRGAGGGPGGGRPGGVAAGGAGAGGGPGGRGPAGGAVPPADGPGGGGGPGRADGGGEVALPALTAPTPYGPQAVVSRGGLVVRDGTGGGGDATGGRSHKLGRMATGRVTRIGPPGERPDAPYMPADSLHRLRDQMRSHLPSAERWTADLPTLLGHPDVPDHLKQQAAPVVAQMEYDRAKTADATRHLKNTPPAQMTRSAFADAVAHADPAEFPDGLYGMFFRSGDLPPGGRSRNGQTRELEAGVSTYPLPRATSLAGLADRPWFFGPGRVVGTGSDDEPLIEPVAEKWTKLAGKGADPAAAFYRWLLQNRPDANTPRDPVK